MELTEGEFSCFSLVGQLWMLEELGTCLFQIETADRVISVYELYGFYVEEMYDKRKDEIIWVRPISFNLLRFYLEE